MVSAEMTPGFVEEWFCEESQVLLAELVVAAPPGLLVEVGSWEGRSTVAMAKAAYPRTVHAVDTWCGSPGEVSAELVKSRDVYGQFLANMAAMTAGNVDHHRSGWRDFVVTVTEPVALVFIDAEHTYREVSDTIEAFLPLMAAGGVMCGDDVLHPPIGEALCDRFGADQVRVRSGTSMWWWLA